MATLQEINDIIAAIQFRPPPPVDPVFVNSLLPLTFDQAVNAVQADGYTQNVVNPVIREYQAAFGTVPDQAGLQFWVQQFGTGQVSLSQLSFTFASSQQFFNTYGVGPTAPPTAGLITALYENVLERAPDQAGLNFWLNSGLNASQLLEEFAQSGEFIQNTNPNIIAFQNAEVAGNPPVPPTSLFDVETTGFTLTTGVDTFIETVDNPVFNAPPGANVLGPSNTLNTGDNVESTAGNGTLNYTAVASPLGNPTLAGGVTLTGVSTANILNTSFGTAGFSGNVTGLTDVSVLAGTVGSVLLGLPGAGLNTALETISINASEDFTAWMTNTALAGNADAVALILSGVSDNLDPDDTDIDLNVTAGTNAYEELNITSTGGTLNELDIDTNGDTTALITVDGAQDLTLLETSSVLDLANLETFDGTEATGNLTVAFNGVGDVVVDGGSGDDDFTFPAGAGAVTVRGNGGDDVFTFLADNGDPTTFGVEDLADGGAGDNRLRLQADEGVLLGAGVGASIVNIQTIEHFTNGVANGDLSVDMAESGSATVLELAGIYDFFFPTNDVDVTNLTNADSVVFSGDNIDDLTLLHTSAVGTVNFTMAQDAVGGTQFISDLIVPSGIIVNLTSGGNADLNEIDDVNFVDANMSITGATNLSLGSGDAYNFDGGIIDAAAFTGDLELFLGTGSQTAIGGSGNDHITIETPSNVGIFFLQADVIDLSAGGADTVAFLAATDFTFGSLAPGAADYHHVIDFTLDDVIEIDTGLSSLGGLDDTAGGFAGNPPTVGVYNNNTTVDFSGSPIDFIKFSTPVTTAGLDADDAFDSAINTNFVTGANYIEVALSGDDFLVALYDSTNSQMVLYVAEANNPGGPVPTSINTSSSLDVVATVGMSFADYQAFDADNLLFI